MQLLFAIAILSLIAIRPLFAGPTLTADTGQNGSGTCTGTAPATSTGAGVGSTLVCLDIRSAGQADASAGIGSLHAKAQAQEFGASNFGTGAQASYSDTVVFTGPGTDPIPVSLNLHFSGTVNSTNEASAVVRADATIYDQFVGRLIASVHDGVNSCVLNTFVGLDCSISYNKNRATTVVLVPLNFPVRIFLALEAGAGANGFGTSGTSDFSKTFGFVTGSPLFDLPAGFTVNSPTSFIVDNRFSTDVLSVSEPNTYALVLSGLGLLGLAGRRWRDSR